MQKPVEFFSFEKRDVENRYGDHIQVAHFTPDYYHNLRRSMYHGGETCEEFASIEIIRKEHKIRYLSHPYFGDRVYAFDDADDSDVWDFICINREMYLLELERAQDTAAGAKAKQENAEFWAAEYRKITEATNAVFENAPWYRRLQYLFTKNIN